MRCHCQALLIRVIPVRGNHLVVCRTNTPPQPQQLAAKAEGTHPGGRNVAPRIVRTEHGTGPKDDLWWRIGWHEWADWLDNPDRTFYGGRCECGRHLEVPVADLRVWVRAGRNVTASEHLLLTSEHADARDRQGFAD